MEKQYLHELMERHPSNLYSLQSGYNERLEGKKSNGQLSGNNGFSGLTVDSHAMRKVYHLIEKVAYSNSTVLILGETGTGKELIANRIHHLSPRSNKPMVKVNCAALPPNLIESELFGHERGSFTGATDRRIGKFEQANNGTLFLDEIGEMPLDMQVKLLRVIQEREVERVGGHSTIKINVRLVVATNRNLEQEVKAGRFRADLFYRLNVFPVHLPSLRERPEDITSLANFFLHRYSAGAGKTIQSISPGVIHLLQSYTWPGNIRELEHLIERSVLLTQSDTLDEIELPSGDPSSSINAVTSLEDMERTYIIDVLKKYKGKIAGNDGAAEFLAIPSTTLHSKMKKLRISKMDYFS